MPIVRVELLEGRPAAVKAALIERLTAVVVETLAVAPEQVRVLLYELPAEHWGIAGQSVAARRTLVAGDGLEAG